MKTFLKFLSESTAVQQATRMGLTGDGHGGWYKNREFVAKTEGGRLKFYNKRQRVGQDPKQTEREKNLSHTSTDKAGEAEEPQQEPVAKQDDNVATPLEQDLASQGIDPDAPAKFGE